MPSVSPAISPSDYPRPLTKAENGPSKRSSQPADLKSAVQDCVNAFERPLNVYDWHRARRDPAAPKRRAADYASLGAECKVRRAERLHLAGHTKAAQHEFASQWLRALSVVGTGLLSIVVGGVGRKAYELVLRRQPLRRRSEEGVREDVLMRSLQRLEAQLSTLPKPRGAQPLPAQATRHQFDALERNITQHPSVRLRGSPHLRKAMRRVATDLGVTDSAGRNDAAVENHFGHWCTFEGKF